MRRISLLLVVVLFAACGGDGAASTAPSTTTTQPSTTTTADDGFPVTVTATNGEVEIAERPDSIVSISPSSTENLFAIGAGDQVVAVDSLSTYPEEAPVTDLSAFTPNTEAILAYQPDLVVISYDPSTLIDELEAVGVPVLLLPSATSLDDVFNELEVLGAATGNIGGAAEMVLAMETEIAAIVDEVGEQVAGTTIYHEVDNTLYSVSSSSYIGELYEKIGLANIADEADPDGFGYPQLSAEHIIASDPDVILLADAGFGESIDTLKGRPGWAEMTAILNGAVIAVDADLASRWTPRSIDLLRLVAESIAQLVPVG